MADNTFQGYYVRENPNEEYDIEFSLQGIVQEIPSEFLELYHEIEKVRIQILNFTNEASKKRFYFNRLLNIAQAGLAGPNATPKHAKISLILLKGEFLAREEEEYKNNYILDFSKWMIYLMIVLIVLYFIPYGFIEFNKYLLVGMGALVGNYFAIFFKTIEVSFEEIVIKRKELKHILKLVFIITSSCIFLMFLDNGVLDIKFGEINLSSFLLNTEKQVFLGIILGILDLDVAKIITNKSQAMIKEK